LAKILAVCCETNAKYLTKNDEQQNTIEFYTFKIFLKFLIIKANEMHYFSNLF